MTDNATLAKRIADLERQLSTANSNNAALAAQVEALTKTIIEAKTVYEEFSLFVWKSFVLEITNSARVCNRRQTYEILDKKFQSIIPDGYVAATPQHHLAEIRAEAVKNEFGSILHSVANQFTGDDTTNPWHNGANHVFVLFAKEIDKRVKLIRKG